MNRRLNLFISLLFILAEFSCYGQFKYNPQALVPFDSAFKIGKLDNGIRYMIRSNPGDKGRAYFYAFFNVGAIQEEPNEYGIAHFVEHMYADYPYNIESNTDIDINGETTENSTQYTIFKVPTQQEQMLDSALLTLKTMPFHTVSSIVIEKERKIILAEWREHSKTDLSKTVQKIQVAGSVKNRHETLGDTAVISHITANQLKQFHDKWYSPDNLTVIVIGDFDALKMEAKIKQIFGSIPKAHGEVSQTKCQLLNNKEPIIEISRTEEDESSVEISYIHNIQSYTQKRLRTELKDQLIAKMFVQRIREALDSQIFPFNLQNVSFGNSLCASDHYNINFQTTGDSIYQALILLQTEKERIDKYGFPGAELEQYKKELIAQYLSAGKNGIELPYVEYFTKCMYYILNGKVSPSFNYSCQFVQKVVPTITQKEVNERFEEYTANIHPIVNILVPEGFVLPTEEKIKAIFAPTNTRNLSPYIAPKAITELIDGPIHAGKVVKEMENKELGTTEWLLSNGMKVVIKPTNFNSNEIIFKGFRKDISQRLKSEYSYLYQYVEELYNRMGLENYSDLRLNQFLETKQFSVSKGFQYFSGYSAPKDIKPCLQLIRLKYLNQRWNELYYNALLNKIKKAFKNRSYQKILDDTIDSYCGQSKAPRFISMEQLEQIYQKVFGDPSAFTFIFSGNMNIKEMKPLVERYLASIVTDHSLHNTSPDTTFYENEPSVGTNDINRQKVCKEFKYPIKHNKALIGLWYESDIKLKEVDYIMIFNFLRSQLNDILREKEHAIYSSSLFRTAIDPFIGFGFDYEVDPKNIKRTNEVAINTINQFMENGLIGADFEFQKARLIQYRIENLKSNSWWVNLALSKYYTNGENIIPDYVSDAKSMTKESFAKIIQRIYSHGHLIDVMMLPE